MNVPITGAWMESLSLRALQRLPWIAIANKRQNPPAAACGRPSGHPLLLCLVSMGLVGGLDELNCLPSLWPFVLICPCFVFVGTTVTDKGLETQQVFTEH